LQLACGGRDAASKRRQEANAREQERLRASREAEVKAHMEQHDHFMLAYRIAFDKVCRDLAFLHRNFFFFFFLFFLFLLFLLILLLFVAFSSSCLFV
jgi:hypothetical protein